MIENQHLMCVPEIKTYILTNLFSGDKIIVTEQMVKDGFSHEDYVKIMSGRNNAWLIEDYYD